MTNKIEKKVKKNSFLAVILKSNKSMSILSIPFSDNEFSHDGNTYFSIPEGMYLNKKKYLLAVYLEGISTPLSHKNIKKKKELRKIINADNKKEIIEVDIIEGLKYDSEIIDILLNRGLAEKFTEIRPDKTLFIIIVMLIFSIIIGIVSVGVEFV
jgi:hypothetical protein